MPRQAIDIPGVGNARELGGYAVGETRVKEGVLLRSAGLANVTPEAIERLQNMYRVQTVIDFRMSVEQGVRPDPKVPGAEGVHVPVVELEDFSAPEELRRRVGELFGDMGANRMELFEIVYGLGMVGPELYVRFLTGERGRKGFAAFFQKLLELEEGRAILWHCTDGKDRTGCAAMLVLFALGATRETVLADYLLTNEYNAAVLDAVRKQVAAHPMPAEKRDALLFMSGGVLEGYLARAIEVLEEGYGSVEGYLREEIGVGEEERERLRSVFLA